VTSINFGDLYKDATTIVTGTFDGLVVEATAVESSNGKPMIKAKLQVEGGKHHGRTYWRNIVVSPESSGAMRMFFVTMKAFGLEGDYFAANPTMDQIARDINGKRCRFTVDKREFQGVDREDVTKVEPPSTALAGIPSPVASGPTMSGIPSPSAGIPGAVPGIPNPTAQAAGGSEIPPPPTAF
jgi:hypothetical protein